MRIATWNVNSLNARLPRVEEWIDYARPDVLCMQETKLADAAFPSMAFSALGYESASTRGRTVERRGGLSRVGLEDVVRGFGGPADDQGARLVAATCGGVRVHSVYVPNGREVGSEHYEAKLAWLGELRAYLEHTCKPTDGVAVCGDFNVAPEDRDVWDPAAVSGATHVTVPERASACTPSRSGVWSTPSGSGTPRTSSSRGGTTAPGTSTSTWACGSTSSC